MSPMMSNVSLSARFDQHRRRALVLRLSELASGVAPLLFHVERSMSLGWFSTSLISAGTSAGCAYTRAGIASAMRNTQTSARISWPRTRSSDVSVVGLDLQLVTRRRTDARDRELLRGLRHALESPNARVVVELVVLGLLQVDRAAVDHAPAGLVHGVRCVGATIELAALGTLAAGAIGDVIAGAAGEQCQHEYASPALHLGRIITRYPTTDVFSPAMKKVVAVAGAIAVVLAIVF